MTNLVDVGVVTIRKKMFPFFIIAALVAVLGSGCSGLYFGYEIAQGRFSTEKLEMASAYNLALAEKEARRKEAEDRSHLIESQFITGLKDIRVVNTTTYQRVEKETEKLVYTDCKVPDTGVDLLNKHIDDVNMRLLGTTK